MKRKSLNLVVNDEGIQEKRVLPRFPFCFLTFKSSKGDRAFEVRDISPTGMQLSFKNSDENWEKGQVIDGEIHWLGSVAKVSGEVQWSSGQRLGIHFNGAEKASEQVGELFSIENIVKNIKPLHENDHGVEIPPKLNTWLRCDGPVELFIWQHANGDIQSFQVLFLNQFVEWQEGAGVSSGKVLSKREIETPLITEDELIFSIDHELDRKKLQVMTSIVKALPQNLWGQDQSQFVLRKMLG